ncbi:hypothetical protein [Pedobacter heparinus]|uniref:Glycosyl transferase n=1 Tax=Pedobacter heparinus (strain ATCC 13125 / DSM 2366 / CIP 104194 / JCM 7457 / NBRC 12017 / NCIMB 9290 / NRRL B-14731 / HIM 762-3) TaxID=485917 RepID=C6XYZ4_PEDHD|nr:hypothetical protein [Pedobacter heparinus]ACU02476.1 conserved hypothetical protein [Pedobacter heparinus DSM 2366]
MLKFCTLFNSAYLSRGLAMYNSLEQHCDDFHLYIVAFDEDCYDALLALQLSHASVIALKDFENEALLAVKMGRTPTEYCWTCSSSAIKYCIETYQLDHCTYVDADLLFFNNPKVLYDEMGDKSVLITKHRFTPCFDQSATSGVYCVQYLTFKNTLEGMTALNWWVDACLEWCFCRMEDNKFGDQKYLDDWTARFKGVHELKHLGGGVAPWNVQQYAFKRVAGKIRGTEFFSNNNFDLVFYHYHAFAYTWNNSYRLTNEIYPLNRNQIRHIYKPYVLALLKAEKTIGALGEHVRAYKRTEEGIWINRVIGRWAVFFLKGFYKQYYSKRFFQYGIFN